jgi:hypothetical protein
MKVVIAVFVTVLVLVPAAFATGQSLDPRVPGLQKQMRLLRGQMAAVQGQVASTQDSLNGKLDKNCVEIVPVVVRNGYVYQGNDGSLFTYKALDEYNASTDSTFNPLMQLKAGC